MSNGEYRMANDVHPPATRTRTVLRRRHSSRRAASRCLFGLAGGGVCPAAIVTNRAVRSYRTISPLPRQTSKRRKVETGVLTFSGFDVFPAVSFLWHFPSGCPGLALPTTAPYPVRTFLPHERTSKLAMPVALNACTVPAIAFARSTNGIVVRRMTFVDVTYFGSTKASPFRH